MILANIKVEDRKMTSKELFNKYRELVFTNDMTDYVVSKIEGGFSVVGYSGYEYEFEMDKFDDVIEFINDIKNSTEMFEDWAEEYLNSIEDYEFKVTNNCINMIYLAKQIQHGDYSYTLHNTYCTDVRIIATEVIDAYFEYVEEVLEEWQD